MYAATLVFKELRDHEVQWLLDEMEEKQYLADEVIIREGTSPGKVYFIVTGLVSVYIEAATGTLELARIGPGELLGDVAWLENSDASASVRALESSLIAALDVAKLEARLSQDGVFAGRFLRALAALGATRLRRLTEYVRSFQTDSDWLRKEPVIGPLVSRLTAFKDLIARADRHAIASKGSVGADLEKQVMTEFGELIEHLQAAVRMEEKRPGLGAQLGQIAQREVLPFVLLTRTAERFYSKPRGYAGDCETIGLIYRNEPGGSGRIGPLLDRAFLDRPAAIAVRNRRRLLAREISELVKASGPASVTSLACGPAEEVFDAYAGLSDKSQLHFSAIDIDRMALSSVSERAEREGLSRLITATQENLVYLALGRRTTELGAQHLIYSIGLIDYFNDEFVVKLLNWIYEHLHPGGRVLLGNFHPRNPDRAFMDHVLEWRLLHRDEGDMDRLFKTSKFAQPCTRILFEDQGINLFAEGVKS